eukprot:3776511-Amphidinium_carterae.1
MEGELAVLESSFARARRELVLRYQDTLKGFKFSVCRLCRAQLLQICMLEQEILQQIVTEEEELLAVSGTLAQKRETALALCLCVLWLHFSTEAAYAAADAVTDLRLILAERM